MYYLLIGDFCAFFTRKNQFGNNTELVDAIDPAKSRVLFLSCLGTGRKGRDQRQDCLPMLLTDPCGVREILIKNAQECALTA